MKALRWHGRHDVRLDDVEEPGPPPEGSVALRVLACGICGTDVEEWRHGPLLIPQRRAHPITGAQAPITLGHELAGEVVGVGPGGDAAALGTLVAVDGLVYCGRCRECLRHRVNLCQSLGQVGLMCDGGLAERVNVPAAACLQVPAGLGPEAGAVAETLSVGVRALRQGRLVPGERVTVFGAGAVGLLAAQAAKAAGASEVVVVEPLASRRRLAEELGADATVDPAGAVATSAPGADVVLECSGSPAAIGDAVAAARSSGRVVLVGLSDATPALPVWDIIVHEKVLVGAMSHVWDEDFSAALALLASGTVSFEPLLTRIPLADSLDLGLRALAECPDRYLKIIVTPEGA